MSVAAVLASISNTYERKARLYPAFLTLVPVVGIAVGLYGFAFDVREATVALLAACGGFYLLANIVRELGKRREEELYKDWGGTPTTQLQRHRDTRIDVITKRDRHAFLSSKLNVAFPTSADELANPDAADQAYAAGTRWLLERTRDTSKFSMLFDENVAYGYRRNALGLKPIAIGICLVSIAWVLGAQGVIAFDGFHREALVSLARGATASLVTSFLFLLVWVFFFTKRTARTAAFSYADMLLRACGTL